MAYQDTKVSRRLLLDSNGRSVGFNYCSYSYDKKIWLLAAAPFNFRGSPSVSPHTGGKAA